MTSAPPSPPPPPPPPTYPAPYLLSRRRLPDTADEQADARAILTTHVALRMVQSLSLLNLFVTPTVFYFRHRGARVDVVGGGGGGGGGGAAAGSTLGTAAHPPPRPLPLPLLRATLTSTLLRTTAGLVPLGAALGLVATQGRMYGMSEIEWRDRAWRLGWNQGQRECDVWSYAGVVGGAVGGAVLGGGGRVEGRAPPTVKSSLDTVKGDLGREARRGAQLPRLVRTVGSAGIGSVVGMLGYMAWRYGVRGGKFAAKTTNVEGRTSEG